MICDTQAKVDANKLMAERLSGDLAASAFGMACKPDQVSHYQFLLVAQDGRGLIVNTNGRTHFSVGCLWPRVDNREYAPNGPFPQLHADGRPYIRVSKSRGFEGLLRDILKRIMPDYAAEFAEQRERGLKEQAGRNARIGSLRFAISFSFACWSGPGPLSWHCYALGLSSLTRAMTLRATSAGMWYVWTATVSPSPGIPSSPALRDWFVHGVCDKDEFAFVVRAATSAGAFERVAELTGRHVIIFWATATPLEYEANLLG